MADLRGTYRSPNGSPYFDYDISYTETSRNGSSAKYRVNLRVRMTSSYSNYGYGIRAYVNINGAKSERQIKSAGGRWSGSSWQGTWSFDVTASAGTGGGTLPAEVRIWGTDGGSAPNMTIGGKTVSVSTWNTAPYWTTDDGNINGWKENKIIPENTGKVHVYPPKAVDKEGNGINYDSWRYVNDELIAKACQNGNVNGFEDDLSDLGQGAKIKYSFRVDDYNAYSDYRWSWTYTKNTLTPANVSISNTIGFDSNSIQINLSGQSNTDGNTSFTFGISSNNFPIYNADSVSGNTTITIYKSGALPTTPYVKFEDIKNFVRNNGWRGTATITVETRNVYGSRASRNANVNIDLRTNPTTVGNINVGGETTVAGGKYFIPSRGAFTVNWSGASDKLGGSILYDLQGAFEGGGWITLKSNLSNNSAQVNLEAVTKSIKYRFRVVAKTNFGYNSYSREGIITLHYYNQPKIEVRNVNRSATQYSADIYTQADTSITAVAINMRQWQDKSGAFHNFAGSPYRFTQSGLGETDSYTKQIKCSDNSGLPESTVILNYQVNSYVPIVSIRKKGLGINTLADDVNMLKVNGRSRAYAFVSEGYETLNPAGDHVNQWVKVASFRVTSRYGDASATIDFLDSGSGSNNPVTGRLRCRLKQQNDFTQESSISLLLENPMMCSADDFYFVVTRNVVGEVIAELWYRCSTSYTSVYFYPSQTLGQVTMYSRQPFQVGIPAGQNIKASYTPRETLIGIGAMGCANVNGYNGLMHPSGNQTEWVRTTVNGIIPYQSGGSGAIGTESWKFNDVWTNRLNGKQIGGTSGNYRNAIPIIGSDGVMEVGKYIDFHEAGSSKDYDARLEVRGNQLYAGGQPLIKTGTPLWTGAWFLLEFQTVTPSKKLSECANGWVLVWSDYDTGVGANNWNYNFTLIPKYGFNSGCNNNFAVTTGESAGTITKTMTIWNDRFTGHTKNDEDGSDDVCLRAVYEF
ncbi:hypothetical protein UT300003_33180 [Clostridium sardiniense]